MDLKITIKPEVKFIFCLTLMVNSKLGISSHTVVLHTLFFILKQGNDTTLLKTIVYLIVSYCNGGDVFSSEITSTGLIYPRSAIDISTTRQIVIFGIPNSHSNV